MADKRAVPTARAGARGFDCDVIVAGGGPAGLASAIACAAAGLRAIVCERRAVPADKACGEGLMPPAVRALDVLGVRKLIAADESAPFDGVRFIDSDGVVAQARLPAPGGLGVRRIALAGALASRAAELGVEIREQCAVGGYRIDAGGVIAAAGRGELRARVLVAADGLGSRLRALAGLAAPARGPRRFGMRRHFRIAPWSRFVEVHLADGIEAYVTPAGRERVGVALLWDDPTDARRCVSFDQFLARFPALAARLGDARADSRVRGAGPMAQPVRARVADRLVLAGDAAGYVDAITGEGLSLAFADALALGRILPRAIAADATRAALAGYDRAAARNFRRYALVTRAVLAIARRPALRRRAVRTLAAHPRLFDALLGFAVGIAP
jgi:flavin-dependent dehydrogenase